jgi:hypothetical protein
MDFENCRPVRVVFFDYARVDALLAEQSEPETDNDDDQFWRASGEMVTAILRWLTEPKNGSVSAERLGALAGYLCPHVLRFQEPVSTAMQAELNEFLVRTQQQFPPQPGYYQKIAKLQVRRQKLRERAKRRR